MLMISAHALHVCVCVCVCVCHKAVSARSQQSLQLAILERKVQALSDENQVRRICVDSETCIYASMDG
jgi:hypothetical protein